MIEPDRLHPPSHVGHSRIRTEGRAKVRGEALYTDDLSLPGLLHGVTIRSTLPRGRLTGIRFDPGFPWQDFVVVTAGDVPGDNRVHMLVHDQPFLAEDRINHPEEPVMLLAHSDRYLLERARRAVHLEVEPEPACLDLQASLDREVVVWGEDNLLKALRIEKGEGDFDWAKAPHVVEGTYATGAQEQLYLEPQGVIATASPAEGVTVWGSLQCPYYVHQALKGLFGESDDARVRVIQMETGGGFGGKEDYPSLIAGHAALLSFKAGGRPVKICYDREEDMVATTKRHPSRSRLRTAFDASGRMLALEGEFLIDGGAYVTLSPVVLSRGAIHAAGPYQWPHVRLRAFALATNHSPHGAFRGFGAPQSLFALERHLDVAAAQLGLDPVELRRKNLLAIGGLTSTGQVIREPLDLPGLMDRALAKLDYHAKREAFQSSNRGSDPVKRGVGFAVFMHGCGFTGGGESHLASVAGVEGTAEGRVRVLAASTEIGQGTNTMFSQVVAEALGLPLEAVEVLRPDTRFVPNSGPTVASRTCMVVGKLVQEAALGLKQTVIQAGLLREPYDPMDFQEAVAAYVAKYGSLKAYSQYHQPPHIQWSDETYRGDAYGTFAWACYAAEVAVDTRTYEIAVTDFVAHQEVGRVINPLLAEGQIEGGVAQGLGYALLEEVQWREGRMANAQMTNYLMPTSEDLPRLRVSFEESPNPMGPCGAKGIGELPLDGPAPAILNAVQQALGTSALREIPLTPERLMAGLEAVHG